MTYSASVKNRVIQAAVDHGRTIEDDNILLVLRGQTAFSFDMWAELLPHIGS